MAKKCLLGLESPVIIATGRTWHCENMDLLAPIDKEGTTYLFSNGEQHILWDDDEVDNNPEDVVKLFNEARSATEEERKQYARIVRGAIFKGDKVVINRGRKMVGEVKIALREYRYDVANTYGHVCVHYLVFEDGTKVNIDHCDVVNCNENQPLWMTDGKPYYGRKFVPDNELNYLFSVGGRL